MCESGKGYAGGVGQKTAGTDWRLGSRRVERVPAISHEERERLRLSPSHPEAHGSLLLRMPFVDAIETAAPPHPLPGAPARARIVAWNAERGRHVEHAAALLQNTAADAFLLSEMDLGMARSGQRHTTRDLARALDCGYAFAVEFLELGLGDEREQELAAGLDNAVGYHGGALLSRHALTRPAVVRLEARGDWFGSERGQRRVGGRIAVLSVLRVAGVDVTLAAVHLDSHGDPDQRARELGGLLAAIDAYAPGQPAVVGGDLNTHTFAASRRQDPEELRRTLAEDPERLRHPMRYEPLFALAEARGFDWRSCNALGASTQRTEQGLGALKLDWFLTRGLRATEPEVIEAVDPAAGGLLSDHEAIAVTVEP
jgi:endonuclease/exonuclease/phosphatase family metal-dependent hydrolase